MTSKPKLDHKLEALAKECLEIAFALNAWAACPPDGPQPCGECRRCRIRALLERVAGEQSCEVLGMHQICDHKQDELASAREEIERLRAEAMISRSATENTAHLAAADQKKAAEAIWRAEKAEAAIERLTAENHRLREGGK